MTIKKWKACEIKYKDCRCCLKYKNTKDDSMEITDKNYQKMFDENFKKTFANTYKLANSNINKYLFYCCEKVFTHLNI